MKVPTRARRRSGALIAGTAAGLVGMGLFATPATAHTPVWTVTCSEVTVDLKAYGGDVTNTVTVTVDGKDLLPAKEFGSSFQETLELPDHKAAVQVRLVVKAGDGERFSHDETKTAPVCESGTPEPSDTPEASKTPEPSDAPEPSGTPTNEPPSSAAPVPKPGETTPGGLAETGGSSATPVIAGAATLAVLAGGGILVATRKRRAGARD
ncbi:LAETG motif-containing sortase-dependent surface protein [Streptomyces sp. SCSIO 30461]|uniref:LAETG motif-containing sortase-dependent surface protein n=1 Tax=Streptomyces sp. SCSIO 30461 TaxID=3118085 RepID=UPI0030CEBF18